LTKINIHEIFQIADIAEKIKVDSFRVLRFMEIGRGDANKILCKSLIRIADFLESFKKKAPQYSIPLRIDEIC